jgi:two-component system, OmpR family, heavy metal sensor histidine kinase CusS
MSRPKSLKSRIFFQTLTLSLVTVALVMGGSLIHLRYGFKRTLDAQLQSLGPDLLVQVATRARSLGQDSFPSTITLFDEKNPVRILRITHPSGAMLFDNPRYDELISEYLEELEEKHLLEPESHVRTHWAKGRTLRVALYEYDGYSIVMAADLAYVDRSLLQILVAFLFMLPLAVAGSAAVSSLLARRITNPLDSIAKQANATGTRDLRRKIAIPNAPEEIDTLIAILNDMMERIERGFRQAERFSADASHELKTPLTVMHSMLEEKLKDPTESGFTMEEIAELMQETTRMRAIVEALVMLAKADEDSLLQVKQRFSLQPVLEDLSEDASAMGEAMGIGVHLESSALPPISGDERLIRLALYNVIKNGIEHAPAGTILTLSANALKDRVSITIHNQGTPIPHFHRERIFERFYRADPEGSRTRGQGLGLGLNLAKEIARAHGGSLELLFSDQQGTCFSFEFPSESS